MLLTENFRPRNSQQQQYQALYPQQDDFESTTLDAKPVSSSQSSAPLVSQYQSHPSNSSLFPIDATTIPRKPQEGIQLDFSSSALPENFDEYLFQDQPPELMQSDSWLVGNPYTPKSAGRFSHHRESSLSSLGSAGPASPFNHNTSNPQIAVTDSAADGFADMLPQDNYHYQLAKTMAPTSDGIFAYHQPLGTESQLTDMVYPASLPMQRPKGDRGLLPAPDFSTAFGPTRSHPTSVASSVGGDSPATPSLGEPDEERRRKSGKTAPFPDNFINPFLPAGGDAALPTLPKLDRTMTDVYGDELYSPNFTITSASHSHMGMPLSPGHDVFAQRLHAANNQHLTAVHSPISTGSRPRSPFRQGSPFASGQGHDFRRFNPSQHMREQVKAEEDAQALRAMKSEPDTPKTISPKDAILEFHEPEGAANFPLFPQQDSNGFLYDHQTKAALHHTMSSDNYHRSPPRATAGGNQFSYSHLQAGLQVPQQYPFIAQPRLQTDSPSRFSAAESSSGESQTPLPRSNGAGPDGGTYTCTYHGCTLRFETPALLQKHKREGHRQAQGLAGTRRSDGPMTSSLLNSQAGPHRCDRINPSTGKPCNTVFSRPYDLTRHEDTIHNARKQKVRCGLCTEEKTFSRADALTRHFRVCHPDVEFPGKHRRRGGHA